MIYVGLDLMKQQCCPLLSNSHYCTKPRLKGHLVLTLFLQRPVVFVSATVRGGWDKTKMADELYEAVSEIRIGGSLLRTLLRVLLRTHPLLQRVKTRKSSRSVAANSDTA